jgi:hypothetical protein
LLEGLFGLTDAIADQSADCYEIDCLISEQSWSRKPTVERRPWKLLD